MSAGSRTFQIDFDFIDHLLWVRTSDDHARQIMLFPKTVAEFYGEVMEALAELGLDTPITTLPCEIADGIAFDKGDVQSRIFRRKSHAGA